MRTFDELRVEYFSVLRRRTKAEEELRDAQRTLDSIGTRAEDILKEIHSMPDGRELLRQIEESWKGIDISIIKPKGKYTLKLGEFSRAICVPISKKLMDEIQDTLTKAGTDCFTMPYIYDDSILFTVVGSGQYDYEIVKALPGTSRNKY